MKKFNCLVVAILLLNIGNGMAQRSDSAKSHHHYLRANSMHGIPNLTDDQKKKIKDLRTPYSKEVLPLKNQLAEKKAHLKTLETAEKADLNAINSTIDEMTQLQAKMAKKHAAHTQAIRSILTDDQRIAFDTRMSSGRKSFRHARAWSHHGNGG